MGERKVLNKYYPADFDPTKILRGRQPEYQQFNIRMMLPMSVQCATCANYIYRGTKFNSRIERVVGETYLGIQVFRFYFKCTKCSAEIIVKTDPKNSDYAVESGARRNFESWRAEVEGIHREKRKRDAEEMGDAMKSLENRSLDSKRLMDIVAALDELKSMKSRQVSVDAILETLKRMNEEKANKLEEEDAAVIRSLYRGLKEQHVRRIYDDEDLVVGTLNINSKRQKTSGDVTENLTGSLTTSNCLDSSSKAGGSGASKDGKLLFKSSIVTISVFSRCPSDSSACKSVEEEKKKPGEMEQNTAVSGCGLQSLCQQYGSEEED